MKKQEVRKRVFTTLKYILKIGIVKSLIVCLAVFTADAEYEIKWKGRNIHLRKGSTDFKVFRQIMVFGQYNISRITTKKVETIIDLGSNIGLSVLHFKSKYPNATIIAVEPEKSNFLILQKNIAGYDNIYGLNSAIWHSNKNLGIYDSGLGEYGYRVVDSNDKQVGTTTAVTINDIIEKFQLTTIDILKIDIEGAEKELFSHNYESWLPKVRCIVIELHDLYRRGCAPAFFKAISSREYDIFCKGEDYVINFYETKPEIAQYV
jgi:FkbM family methyltransferase